MAVALGLAAAADGRADDFGSAGATLSRPGQAVEVQGTRTRVIAFFEAPAARPGYLDLTVLMTGNALGAEVMRTRLALREGQSHAVTLGGGEAGGRAERFRFTRSGDAVEVAFSTFAPPPERAAEADGRQLAELAQ